MAESNEHFTYVHINPRLINLVLTAGFRLGEAMMLRNEHKEEYAFIGYDIMSDQTFWLTTDGRVLHSTEPGQITKDREFASVYKLLSEGFKFESEFWRIRNNVPSPFEFSTGTT